jgi:hypothetical protein
MSLEHSTEFFGEYGFPKHLEKEADRLYSGLTSFEELMCSYTPSDVELIIKCNREKYDGANE